MEPGYLNDETKFTTMRSALAVPLIGLNGTVSVLTLYHTERDAFNNDHLRILLAIVAQSWRCPSKTRCSSSRPKAPPPPIT